MSVSSGKCINRHLHNGCMLTCMPRVRVSTVQRMSVVDTPVHLNSVQPCPFHCVGRRNSLLPAMCVEENVHLSLPSRYHLKDAIVGKIYFLLVRIKIQYMELTIVRREVTGTGNAATFHACGVSRTGADGCCL